MIGGAGSDHIQGVHSQNGRGTNERDRLEGGDLSDVFYLGDEYGAYYLDIGDGMVSFAHIVDFDQQDKLALANKEGVRVIRNTTAAGVDGVGVGLPSFVLFLLCLYNANVDIYFGIESDSPPSSYIYCRYAFSCLLCEKGIMKKIYCRTK